MAKSLMKDWVVLLVFQYNLLNLPCIRGCFVSWSNTPSSCYSTTIYSCSGKSSEPIWCAMYNRCGMLSFLCHLLIIWLLAQALHYSILWLYFKFWFRFEFIGIQMMEDFVLPWLGLLQRYGFVYTCKQKFCLCFRSF